jgi:hypothetical protein
MVLQVLRALCAPRRYVTVFTASLSLKSVSRARSFHSTPSHHIDSRAAVNDHDLQRLLALQRHILMSVRRLGPLKRVYP